LHKLGVTLSATSPNDARDAKSSKTVSLSLLGFLGISSALFYWIRKKEIWWPSVNLPVVEAAFESDHDVPKSERLNFLAETVEKAMPAVVHIASENQLESQTSKKIIVKRKSGSGFIVDERGYVLTNAHVIANASQPRSHISVQLHSGEIFRANVIDVDQDADLALIKLEAKSKQKFPTLKFRNSTKPLRPGEWVLALGSPLALKNTVTSGIVSTVSRTSKEIGLKTGRDMEYIQTDAAITKGNSGGPLVNLDGEVVGINTLSRWPGISFSIPSQKAEEFIKAAHIPEKPKKYVIGINIIFVDPATLDHLRHIMSKLHDIDIPADVQQGVFVARVWPGTPASGCLQKNDIIVKIDEVPVVSSSQVYDMVQKGKLLNIEVIRGREGRVRFQVTPRLDH